MQTTELSIFIPADATYADALRIVNQELGRYAKAHPRVGGRQEGLLYPATRLLRFEPDAVVYEVEDACDAPDSSQAATCGVAEAEMMNRPCGDAERGYGADVGV